MVYSPDHPEKLLFNPGIEIFFQNISDAARPLLENGRSFDIAHTEAVAYHARLIALQEFEAELDPIVLVTSAYLHELEHSSLFKEKKGDTYNQFTTASQFNRAKRTNMALDVLADKYFHQVLSIQQVAI